MKHIKTFENDNNFELIAEIIKELINPLVTKLQIEKFKTYLKTDEPQLYFDIWTSMSNETADDYIKLFKIFSEYGLEWYKDDSDSKIFIDLDKYNDKMKIYIDSRKYNL